MRITPSPLLILLQWVSKAAVIVSAIIAMPLLRAWCWPKLGTVQHMLEAWPRLFQHMVWMSVPLTLCFYAVAVLSIVYWWRKPSWRTFIWLFFAIPLLCGVPGYYLINDLCLGGFAE